MRGRKPSHAHTQRQRIAYHKFLGEGGGTRGVRERRDGVGGAGVDYAGIVGVEMVLGLGMEEDVQMGRDVEV